MAEENIELTIYGPDQIDEHSFGKFAAMHEGTPVAAAWRACPSGRLSIYRLPDGACLVTGPRGTYTLIGFASIDGDPVTAEIEVTIAPAGSPAP